MPHLGRPRRCHVHARCPSGARIHPPSGAWPRRMHHGYGRRVLRGRVGPRTLGSPASSRSPSPCPQHGADPRLPDVPCPAGRRSGVMRLPARVPRPSATPRAPPRHGTGDRRGSGARRGQRAGDRPWRETPTIHSTRLLPARVQPGRTVTRQGIAARARPAAGSPRVSSRGPTDGIRSIYLRTTADGRVRAGALGEAREERPPTSCRLTARWRFRPLRRGWPPPHPTVATRRASCSHGGW